MNPLLSLILPIYNVELYLRECLDSAVNQTYKNLEIICMDDGSTDSCSEIIDEYAAKDSRIIAVHKQNEGYGVSVNRGIDMAHGKWIAILEPDDYAVPYMYEELIKLAELNKVDFIKSNFYEFREKSGKREYIYQRTIVNSELYDKTFTPREHLNSMHGFCSTWSGLYNREFLNKYNIRHNNTPGASYQDVGFNFLTNIYSDRAYYTHLAFYHYRCDNPNASVHQKNKVYFINKELGYIRVHIEKYKIIDFLQIADIYIFYKLLHYRSNVQRISFEYKMEFIEYCSKDLWYHIYNSEFKISLIEKFDKLFNVKSLLLYPQNYYELIINQVEDKSYLIDFYRDFCKKFDKIWLYGAGIVGQRYYYRLLNLYSDKIQGFFVSEVSGETPENLFGKPVKKFDLKLIDKETLIIITAGTKNVVEIERILVSNNIYNYVNFFQIDHK